jgi:hypothetical protein
MRIENDKPKTAKSTTNQPEQQEMDKIRDGFTGGGGGGGGGVHPLALARGDAGGCYFS